jgi:hypothetical protein
MMSYSEILQHGHWEAFLEYLWQHHDYELRTQRSAKTWAQSVQGDEIEGTLLTLFEGDGELLAEQVGKYIEHVARQHPKGHCLRCNRGFATSALHDCQLCGWDFESASQGEINALGLEINEHLNAQYIEKQLSCLQAAYQFERLDNETKWWSVECERIKEAEPSLRAELLERQSLRKKKIKLEHTLRTQDEQIKNFEQVQKNAESLFLKYNDRQPEQSLTLVFKGHILHVKAPPPLKFPIALVMGVQKTTDGVVVKTVNKTCCFVFIHENDWESIGNHEWKVDLFEIANGKIAGDFYVNYFSHLHKKDGVTLRYDTKRLTFPL